MQTTIAKWGNSLALRLPRDIAKDARLKEGTRVTVEVSDGCIILKPAHRRPTMAELLAGFKAEHRHDELDWGSAVGNEKG